MYVISHKKIRRIEIWILKKYALDYIVRAAKIIDIFFTAFN